MKEFLILLIFLIILLTKKSNYDSNLLASIIDLRPRLLQIGKDININDTATWTPAKLVSGSTADNSLSWGDLNRKCWDSANNYKGFRKILQVGGGGKVWFFADAMPTAAQMTRTCTVIGYVGGFAIPDVLIVNKSDVSPGRETPCVYTKTTACVSGKYQDSYAITTAGTGKYATSCSTISGLTIPSTATSTPWAAPASSTPCIAGCPAGTYQASPGTCPACPIGQYQSTANYGNSCTLCPIGQTTPSTGSNAAGSCSACTLPAGAVAMKVSEYDSQIGGTSFDNSSAVPSSPVAYTISMDVKIMKAGNNWRSILSCSPLASDTNVATRRPALYIVPNTRQLHFVHSTGSDNNNLVTVSGGAPYGVYYNLTITVSSTTIQVYFNGVLQSIIPNGGSATTSLVSSALAASSGYSWRWMYNGSYTNGEVYVKNFYYWPRTLTSTEVTQVSSDMARYSTSGSCTKSWLPTTTYWSATTGTASSSLTTCADPTDTSRTYLSGASTGTGVGNSPWNAGAAGTCPACTLGSTQYWTDSTTCSPAAQTTSCTGHTTLSPGSAGGAATAGSAGSCPACSPAADGTTTYWVATSGCTTNPVSGACPSGQYQSAAANTTSDRTCGNCTNLPTNATYSGGAGTNSGNCPWTCNSGWGASGGACVPVIPIAASTNCTFVIKGGQVYGWGWSTYLAGASTTAAIPSLTGVTALSACYRNAAAVSGGRVYCWGDNGYGQLGGASTTTPVSGLTGVTAVASGYIHTVALAGGRVYCWGDNTYSQLGGASTTTPVSGLTGVTDVACGMYHTIALAGGLVYCWGYNASGRLGGASTTTPVPGLTGVTAIAAGGGGHTVAVAGGRVYCWGDNSYSQLGGASTTTPVPGLTGVTAVGAGGQHTVALAGGLVYCWGDSGYSQLGGASTTTAVSGLTGVKFITVGFFHTVALQTNGTVSCWGNNGTGQLGDGGTTSRNAPYNVGTYIA